MSAIHLITFPCPVPPRLRGVPPVHPRPHDGPRHTLGGRCALSLSLLSLSFLSLSIFLSPLSFFLVLSPHFIVIIISHIVSLFISLFTFGTHTPSFTPFFSVLSHTRLLHEMCFLVLYDLLFPFIHALLCVQGCPPSPTPPRCGGAGTAWTHSASRCTHSRWTPLTTLHSSFLIPHSSFLIPHSSLFAPFPSHFTPHTSPFHHSLFTILFSLLSIYCLFVHFFILFLSTFLFSFSFFFHVSFLFLSHVQIVSGFPLFISTALRNLILNIELIE